MKRICVYCGSSPGAGGDYIAAAKHLGEVLAGRGLELVFGGASAGLMKVVSESALDAGGRAIGVAPKFIVNKIGCSSRLSELHVVENMHERKAMMIQLSDGFIALPGGYGTAEELVEAVTWGMIGFHDKPCGLLNVNGYYDSLLAFFDHAASERFLSRAHRDMIIAAKTPEEILERFETYSAPYSDKWLDRDRV